MVKPVNRGKGRWMITVCCGYESGRKQLIRRTIHLDPRMTETAQRREAEKQTALLLAQYETGRLNSDSSLTLEQFAALWFRDYADRRGLSEKTKHHYMFLLTSRILPYLGRVKLRDIRPRTLHQFYARLDQDEISGATKHKYHALLHNMLGAAVRWQILPFNPADSVEAPRRDTKEITPYTDEQAAAMLACLHTEPVQWQAYVLLALYGQLRRGEMVALDWDDVDLLSSVITIRQAAAYVPGQGVALKRPKTASGTRTIAVPTNVYLALRRWRAVQNADRLRLAEDWQSNAVFTQWNGARMHPDTPTRWFPKFLQRHDLPHIRLHDLRHTGASLLIAGGMDIETVKKRLGHAKASTTMDIYGHAYAKNDKKAADMLREILEK